MHTDTGQIMCAIGHKQTSFHIEKSEDGDVHGSEDGSFIKKLKTLAFFTWHKTKLQCTMPPTSKCADIQANMRAFHDKCLQNFTKLKKKRPPNPYTAMVMPPS